ncbi:hypothetical protein ASPCADRAFT_9364 [Aspergillus carbonarius ITEM 5010]|uniref:Uncharacterized protein n=1 Tax=Aspergillus carbonarius (strain ITEM 5010) TaxID=602072 RepID=A0A1R3RBU3_ASPC5|nr:hypothetical protein ASPCADRAFT_9364 [Aspergillus carbonarius ITEM 5010]
MNISPLVQTPRMLRCTIIGLPQAAPYKADAGKMEARRQFLGPTSTPMVSGGSGYNSHGTLTMIDYGSIVPCNTGVSTHSLFPTACLSSLHRPNYGFLQKFQ